MDQKLRDDSFLWMAMRSFLFTAQDLIFFKDKELRYRGASQAFAKMAGFQSAEDIVGKTDYEIFSAQLANSYVMDDTRVLESGCSIVDYIERLPDRNGKKSYSSTSKHLIRDPEGNVVGLYGIGRDVTLQIELEEERERHELSRRMFEDVLEADISTNRFLSAEGALWAKNLMLTENTTFEEAVASFANHFVHPDYIESFLQYYEIGRLTADYENGVEEFSHLTYQCLNDKAYKWVQFHSRLYYSRVSGTLRMTTFIQDLDEGIRMRERLKRKVETDSLTGLPNRDCVLSRIEEYLENCGSDLQVMLFIDLNNFKAMNDAKGHAFGDEVLRDVGQSLRMAFRREDIVGRVGGDEFLALLKNMPGKEQAKQRAERILAAIESGKCGKGMRVTCSIGAAVHAPGKSFATLYAEADEAMSRAKKIGRPCVVFY